MTVKDVARMCHEMNRAYCQFLGDDSQLAWKDAPQWQRQSTYEAVGWRLANLDAPPSAQHVQWMKDRYASGWVYGPHKDPFKKTHPCLVPFDDLPKDQQLKDTLFVAVVRASVEGLLDEDE
jgi:hypothetical protein